jgi:thymidylate kinase
MIIILEGPDGSGKTTLAQKLQDLYNLDYHHEGPTPNVDSVLQYYIDTFDNITKNDNIVIDRFALGECVYGPTLRGKDQLKLNGWYAFQHHLSGLHKAIHQFVCLPPIDVCFKAWKDNQANEFFSSRVHYLESYCRFSWFTFHFKHVLRWYDWTNPTHDIPFLMLGGLNASLNRS